MMGSLRSQGNVKLTPVMLLINSLKVKGAGMTIGFKVSAGASGGSGMAANTAYRA